jgi:hypothetical protein
LNQTRWDLNSDYSDRLLAPVGIQLGAGEATLLLVAAIKRFSERILRPERALRLPF